MNPRLQPRTTKELGPNGELVWERLERAEIACAGLNERGELSWDTRPMDAKVRRTCFRYRGDLYEQWAFRSMYDWGFDHIGEEL